ncbi:uncharacterized protein LOC130939998 [Arachis stenosperma]|uniref:uncharacterized protein LOC130939998 n=1 Tax=Arachis stenosperma TaxID=217475 RepID=UPI0025AC9560|nr:uncharacterized protein LOC130939998 [Arachis stenosperma]
MSLPAAVNLQDTFIFKKFQKNSSHLTPHSHILSPKLFFELSPDLLHGVLSPPSSSRRPCRASSVIFCSSLVFCRTSVPLSLAVSRLRAFVLQCFPRRATPPSLPHRTAPPSLAPGFASSCLLSWLPFQTEPRTRLDAGTWGLALVISFRLQWLVQIDLLLQLKGILDSDLMPLKLRKIFRGGKDGMRMHCIPCSLLVFDGLCVTWHQL